MRLKFSGKAVFIPLLGAMALLSGCAGQVDTQREPVSEMSEPEAAAPTVGVYIDGPDTGPDSCAINWHFIYPADIAPHTVLVDLETHDTQTGKFRSALEGLPISIPNDYSSEMIYGMTFVEEDSVQNDPCERINGKFIIRECSDGDCPAYEVWEHPMGYDYPVAVEVIDQR